MRKKLPKILNIFFIIVFCFQIFSLLLISAHNVKAVQFIPEIKEIGYKGGEIEPNSIGLYIKAIYKYAIVVIALLAVITMMFGGILWITAAGSPDRVTEAKSWIGSSITGLVLALLSYIILYNVNPNLVNFEPVAPIAVEEIGIGRCLTSCVGINNCVEGLYCEDNTTFKECRKKPGYKKWEAGKYCPTECCAWDYSINSTELHGLGRPLYNECISRTNLSSDACKKKADKNKRNNSYSYKKNGRCKAHGRVYECVKK